MSSCHNCGEYLNSQVIFCPNCLKTIIHTNISPIKPSYLNDLWCKDIFPEKMLETMNDFLIKDIDDLVLCINYEIWNASVLLDVESSFLQDLMGLPDNLPLLQKLRIGFEIGYGYNLHIDFKSFKGIPNKLPKLRIITLNNSELRNFDYLPLYLPNLEEVNLKYQPLSNFLGFPQEIPNFKCFYFELCDIYSFEGFPQPEYKFSKNSSLVIKIKRSKVYCLTGLTLSWFKFMVKQLFNEAGSSTTYYYAEIDNSINRYREIFNLSPEGMKLLEKCIQWDVFNQYFPTFQMTTHLDEYDRFPEWDNLNEDECNIRFRNYPENWIDGYEISDRLFIDENLNLLYEYYKNTPIEIAYQYRNNPNSVPQDQIDRLKKESDYRVLKVLEPFVPIDDPILNYLILKFSIQTQTDQKILL